MLSKEARQRLDIYDFINMKKAKIVLWQYRFMDSSGLAKIWKEYEGNFCRDEKFNTLIRKCGLHRGLHLSKPDKLT